MKGFVDYLKVEIRSNYYSWRREYDENYILRNENEVKWLCLVVFCETKELPQMNSPKGKIFLSNLLPRKVRVKR